MFLFGGKKSRPVVSAVVVAAGKATRMEGIDKQQADLCGMPVIVHTLMAFDQCPEITETILVCREEEIPDYLYLTGSFDLRKLKSIVKGGQSRQESVFAGVRSASEQSAYFCIHDGARPLVSGEVISRCVQCAQEYGAAAAAVPVKDTIKVSTGEGFIAHTPDRATLYATQTPQVFSAALYREAMERARGEGKDYTDDCQLVESLGQRVYLAQGDYRNVKITTPEDLLVVQALYLGEELMGL